MRIRLLLAATTAPLIAIPPATAQAAAHPILPDTTMLEISATGRVTRTPDLATIRAGVVTQAAGAAAAMADNATRMARVLAALKAAGISERDLTTSNVTLAPQYRYAENQPPAITGYQASNTVSVQFRDIARSGRILDSLAREGANQIDGPSLSIDQPDAAFDAARKDAVARAKARADLYAAAAGLKVIRIVSISEAGDDAGNTPPPMLYRAKAVAEADSTTVLAGQTDVRVTITARFILE